MYARPATKTIVVVDLIRHPLYQRALKKLAKQGDAHRRQAQAIDRAVRRCRAYGCTLLYDGGELRVLELSNAPWFLQALQIPYQDGFLYVFGLLRLDPAFPSRAALELMFL